jgi:hypothetical protein
MASTTALFEKDVLGDEVGFPELKFRKKEQSIIAAEREAETEIECLSAALEESRLRCEEASSIIDALLKKGASSIEGPSSCPTTSETIARAGLGSRKPFAGMIINGDANHSHPELLKSGWSGGELAAARFKQELSRFVGERKQLPEGCAIKVQIFMNCSGYVDTVSKAD